MSPDSSLTSQLFSEAACPPQGQGKRLPKGVGLRVLQFLHADFPNTSQPAHIAQVSRSPYAGTKKWLTRNNGVWVVNDRNSGWYRARASAKLLKAVGMTPLALHAIQVRIQSPEGGLPPQLRGLGTGYRTKDGQEMRRAVWNGHEVTVQAAGFGALLSMRSSKNPVTVPLFNEFSSWVHDLAYPGHAMVEGYDLGVDGKGHRVRVVGCQSMSLGGFHSGLLKMYNKQVIGATRLEACFHRLDLSMSEVARVLNEIATPPYDPGLFPPTDPREVA
jgi:hypothetical protein